MDSSLLDGIVVCLDMKRELTGINVDRKILLVKGGRIITCSAKQSSVIYIRSGLAGLLEQLTGNASNDRIDDPQYQLM